MNDYEFWSSRYKSQAQWTKNTRQFILSKLNLPLQANILEVGCGSSAVLNEFVDMEFNSYGIDIDYPILRFGKENNKDIIAVNADGFSLPFADEYFDFCFCHYLLLWLNNPIPLLREMVRVLKKSGWVCCFAEPDYLSRIDVPPPLEKLGEIQNQSLENQGVNLSTGRNVINWISSIDLHNINWGIIGSHTESKKVFFNDDLEWETFSKDIQDYLPINEILNFQNIDQKARSTGNRILFIPTFYAYAQK